MTSQCYQFKVLLHLLPFDRNLKGGGAIANYGVGGVLAGLDSHQPKACGRLPGTSQYRVLLYLSPFFSGISMSSFNSTYSTPIWEIGWTYGVENGTN